MTEIFNELLQASFWFLPIPFMLLYSIKTKKLNFMYKVTVIVTPILISWLFLFNFQWKANPVLTSYYILTGLAGLLIFKRKYDFPQAISLVFNIVFLNLLYWESPIYIYTIIHRGYIGEAISLHILPIFSFYFLCFKLKFKFTKDNLLLLSLGFGLSCLALYFLVYSNINIWYAEDYLTAMYWFKEVVYSIARTVCLIVLYYIFYNCEERKKK